MDGIDIFSMIEKLLNLGVPVAILVVIVWLAIKYAPGAIKAIQSLGENIKLNTLSQAELKLSYDKQVDRLSVVTAQLEDTLQTLGKVEAKQVTLTEFNKLIDLVYGMQLKINDLHANMGGNNE